MLLALALATAPAHAAEPTFDAALGVSYWGLGLRGAVRPGLKQPLWNQEGSLLFSDTFLHGYVGLEVTPAYARVVPTVVFSPIAVLEVTAHYAYSGWFGTFSTLKAFDRPDADYSDPVLAEMTGAPGTGHRYGGEVTLQGKAGPVIVALWGNAEHWVANPVGGRDGCCFYESERELLFGWEENYVAGNGVALYEADLGEGRKLRVGNVTNWSKALSTDDVLLRSGLLAAYTMDEHWTFVLLSQPYLISRVYTTAFPPYTAGQVRWSM